MAAGAGSLGGSGRRGADAADLVLAAIQTTRQHAHVHSQRSGKAVNSSRVKQVRERDRECAMLLTAMFLFQNTHGS